MEPTFFQAESLRVSLHCCLNTVLKTFSGTAERLLVWHLVRTLRCYINFHIQYRPIMLQNTTAISNLPTCHRQVDRFLRVWRVLSFATDAIFFRRSASSTQLGPKMLSMMSLPAKFTNGMLTINDRAPRVCVGRLLLTLLVILLTGYISLPDDTWHHLA